MPNTKRWTKEDHLNYCTNEDFHPTAAHYNWHRRNADHQVCEKANQGKAAEQHFRRHGDLLGFDRYGNRDELSESEKEKVVLPTWKKKQKGVITSKASAVCKECHYLDNPHVCADEVLKDVEECIEHATNTKDPWKRWGLFKFAKRLCYEYLENSSEQRAKAHRLIKENAWLAKRP